VVTLAREADVDPRIIVYLNRLSDLLFVLARFENHLAGRDEDRW
jgi:cob(I)alamin adenosyltransferase